MQLYSAEKQGRRLEKTGRARRNLPRGRVVPAGRNLASPAGRFPKVVALFAQVPRGHELHEPHARLRQSAGDAATPAARWPSCGGRSASSAPGGGSGWRWPRRSTSWACSPTTASRRASGPSSSTSCAAHLDDIDFARAAEHERRLRHDVMAHIHTYGEACPAAARHHPPRRDQLLRHRQHRSDSDARRSAAAARSARRRHRRPGPLRRSAGATWPTLGFTHFQPAQLTTVGKRACLWCYDFVLDLHEIEHRLETLRFRGAKGTTGTQASFLALFQRRSREGPAARSAGGAARWASSSVYPVTGQTYSRKVDSQVLDALSGLGQTAHKFGTDLRLLAHRQEVEEPFEAEQVGSSAMAYKRNPMRAERMCGLARFCEHPGRQRRPDGGHAMAGAHAGRQRQSPADAAAGVPGGRRRAAAGTEHQRRPGRQSRT